MSDLEELQEIGRELRSAENEFENCVARLHASQDHWERNRMELMLSYRRRDVDRLRAEYDLCKARLRP